MGTVELVVGRYLSSDMESSGQFLLKNLEQKHFPISAAMWFLYPDQYWKFILVVDDLPERGPTSVFREISKINRNSEPTKYKPIQLDDIEVKDKNSFVYQKLKGLINPDKSSIRVTNSMFNGFEIVDCMIYKFK